MAASVKMTAIRHLWRNTCSYCTSSSQKLVNKNTLIAPYNHRNFSVNKLKYKCQKGYTTSYRYVTAVAGLVTTVGFGVYISNVKNRIYAHSIQRPQHKPLRSIKSETDSSGLKITLYQYQTCPFCTKVRTYLDYMGISYDVVEVNSVWRTEMKWSKYKKVPVVLLDGIGEDGFLQLNDSTVIISILESYMENRSQSIEKIASYYPQIETKNAKGKTVYEFPNKYNVMYGETGQTTWSKSLAQQKAEMKWRKWADDWLVHTLSPNIYRTPREALQAFRYFDEVGEWNKVFSSVERTVVIYLGACAMWLIGKKLKRKYQLEDDVRLSLYQACSEWSSAVSKKGGKFMGGKEPSLADLAVYGSLNAIEGCRAFDDALKNTNIGPWYYATKQAVSTHAGAKPENAKR